MLFSSVPTAMLFNYKKCTMRKQKKKIIGLRESTLTKYIVYFFTPPGMTPWWAAPWAALIICGCCVKENHKGSRRSKHLYQTSESRGFPECGWALSPGMAPSLSFPALSSDLQPLDLRTPGETLGAIEKFDAEGFPFRLSRSHTFREDQKSLGLSAWVCLRMFLRLPEKVLDLSRGSFTSPLYSEAH